jgi:hypothetical protein
MWGNIQRTKEIRYCNSSDIILKNREMDNVQKLGNSMKEWCWMDAKEMGVLFCNVLYRSVILVENTDSVVLYMLR